MRTSARWAAIIGGFLLLVTAAYHGSGILEIASELEALSLPEPLVKALSGLWIFFSWHLVVVAAAALLVSFRAPGWARWPLLFCGVVAFGDFLLVLKVSGWFAGTLLLSVAAACLLVGSILASSGIQRMGNRVEL